MERLIDLAARECGFDRVAIRKRNLVTEREMPYKNPFGVEYDNGDYIGGMDMALKLGDWAGFKKRRAAAKKRGKYRGIGVGNYVDISTGVPREKAEITVLPEGAVELVIGIVSQGQGHETSFAQLITEWLGVPIECVRFVAGDTDRVTVGGGAHSGRGMRLGSIVIKKSSDGIIEKGMRIAEHLLETAAADIEFKNGRFAVKGTNHAVGLFEVARAAAERTELAGRICAGRSTPPATRPWPRRAFPTARMSARSKSIRTPASCASSTMSRSTMSAARSIR